MTKKKEWFTFPVPCNSVSIQSGHSSSHPICAAAQTVPTAPASLLNKTGLWKTLAITGAKKHKRPGGLSSGDRQIAPTSLPIQIKTATTKNKKSKALEDHLPVHIIKRHPRLFQEEGSLSMKAAGESGKYPDVSMMASRLDNGDVTVSHLLQSLRNETQRAEQLQAELQSTIDMYSDFNVVSWHQDGVYVMFLLPWS